MKAETAKSRKRLGYAMEFRPEQDIFLLQNFSNRLCGPPSLIFNRHKRPFTRVKPRGHEMYQSPPPDNEVKNEWSYTSPYTPS
jgi:hypothetical protein